MFNHTHAFSSFSVSDLAQAKQFYSEVLGLEVTENPQGLNLKIDEGAEVFVYPKPNHEPATFTVLNFIVSNVEKAVDELTEKGVTFEQYDSEYMKTDAKGIARSDKGTTIAWFKDPAGNFIAVMEESSK